MRDSYPKKFILTGLVELTYEDFSTKSGMEETVVESKRSVFIQQYSLGLQGYIYDPRIAVFDTGVTLRTGKSKYQDLSKSDSRGLNYKLSATFLPYRPISLSVYAGKTDATVSSSTSLPYNAFSRSYGSGLKVDLKRFPFVNLEYNHWDYHDESGTRQTESDRFSLDIRGNLRSILTRYLWSFELGDFKGPSTNRTSLEIRGYTDTTIKKENILRTRFYYSDITYSEAVVSKFLDLSLDLEMTPAKRFAHDYMYSFNRVEDEKTDTNTHRLTGRWQFRFNDDLTGRASTGVGTSKKNSELVGGTSEEQNASYSFGTGLNYRKYIVGLDFRSYYNFSYNRKTEDETEGIPERKETMHNLGFNVLTRKLSFATLHADYDFVALKTDLADTTAHSFRVGLSGKGPVRAYWTLEGVYQKAAGDIIVTEEFDTPVLTARPGSSYELRGEVAYPLGTKGLFTFNSGYTAGKNDGVDNNSFYYEGRLNYRIIRNLSFLIWLRESRDKVMQDNIDRITRDVNLTLYYRFRMLFFTVEARYQEINEATAFSKNMSSIFTLRRPF